jgi:hypothetical protein
MKRVLIGSRWLKALAMRRWALMTGGPAILAGVMCGLVVAWAMPGAEVVELGGAIPVAQEVDVVVVGGSSGGVAAAVAAAQNGARVFLAAARPYLGEDICATYRLWLEPGEEPSTDLARAVFRPPTAVEAEEPAGPNLPFQYVASRPAADLHPDTAPPSRLRDGRWHSAVNQSVQYNGDVVLTLDLGQIAQLGAVTVWAYQRPGDFEVAQVAVSVSSNQASWTAMTVITNTQLGLGAEDRALSLRGRLNTHARYVRLDVTKTPQARRLLLGEVVVEGPPTTELPREPAASLQAVRPMQVKRALDQALLDAGVPFLYGSYPIAVLRDSGGQLAGVVIANRSGRQAVVAKVVIDATDQAAVARLAGVGFRTGPILTQELQRVVVGGPARSGDSLRLRQRTQPVIVTDRAGQRLPLWEYLIQIPLRDHSFAAWAEAEQIARDLTWTTEALDSSEVLFQVPSESVRSDQPWQGPWPGPAKLPLEALQPAGAPRLFVLGGCADVPRAAAAELVRPVHLMAVGQRLGSAAAQLARRLEGPRGVHAPGMPGLDIGSAKARALWPDADFRHAGARTVLAEARRLPVLGDYDVVVVGGGTAGAPAGIGAGRQGARTLLIEYLYGLGGVGTLGYISRYYHGNRVGFTAEVSAGVAALSPPDHRTAPDGWDPEHKSEWYRRELRKAGVDIWFGALGVGAVVEDGRVRGVVVLTPFGPGVVRAKVVVDATGNADIAAAAGAACRYTDDSDVAVQGAGLPPRQLGQRYTNTDYTFVDDTDVFDLWRVLVVARQKFHGAYDLGQLIDTRERRQIVGDFTLSPMDMLLGRTYPDTIVIARSNFDTHGYIVHPLFMLRPPDRADVDVRVPYRCLLPRGLDGILVTGLGVSAHRDALPVIRMQPDVQNQGYAAGVAAAWIARAGSSTRGLDIKALQRHLIEKGILPARALTETDSFPLPEERVRQAVAAVAHDYAQLEVVLARFDLAQPLLRQALTNATSDSARLIYAHILGMMGDPAGAAVLAEAVARTNWDTGWRFTGMGQYGPCMSRVDSWIIALGRTRHPLALEPILQKARQLGPDSEFSHFRAVALALEALADPAAAPVLAGLLQLPGISGHAVTNITLALQKNPPSPTDTTTRNQALTELYLARALYRCGDHQGVGEKILRQYAQDLHGHYARHARAVLASGSVTRPRAVF